jgi:hypothetical protein
MHSWVTLVGLALILACVANKFVDDSRKVLNRMVDQNFMSRYVSEHMLKVKRIIKLKLAF